MDNTKCIKIVQIGLPTCAPCFSLKAKAERWIKIKENEGVEIEYEYISADKNPAAAAAAGIFTVPAIIVYIDGNLTIKESGYFSFDLITEKLERYLYLRGESD